MDDINKKHLYRAICLYTLGMLIFAAYIYFDTKKNLIHQVDNKLLSAAYGTAHILKSDFHDDLEKDSIHLKAFNTTARQLSTFADDVQVTYVYSLLKHLDQIYFTSTSNTKKEWESNKIGYYFQPYPEATETMHTLFGQDLPIFEQSRDHWGEFRSVLIPLTSDNGTPYIVGADINISYVRSIMLWSVIKAIIMSLLIPMLVIPLFRLYLKILKKSALAQASSVSKSQFLANMSHELRTPLNGIIGYSELLSEQAEEEEREQDFQDLQKILQASKHLLGLINDILDLSKIDAGKMALVAEDFELQAFLSDIESEMEQTSSKNGNQLVTHFPNNLGEIFTDRLRLRQVIYNLLSNACKFSQNADIEFNANRHYSPKGDTVIIQVKDQGIGMTKAQLARLFTDYSQAHEQIAHQYGGTGLGLSLSLRLCELMACNIDVSSQPGQGSTFTLTIPVST